MEKFQWPDFSSAILKAHNPRTVQETEFDCLARERLAFDELFAHQMSLALARLHFRKFAASVFVGPVS